MNHAWNDEVQAFTQAYGSKDLDASVLLMESYGFIEARNPKFVSTVKAIERELVMMVFFTAIKIRMILDCHPHPLLFVRFGLLIVCIK